ncbi:hypothetical protein [Archangium violaceum]|uniref:Uncharacterized protein n=1 Tax=Archangium violaceum Cb vi76 TaxID=1406225 RepID=A0A084ST66_9BACT|nr:hypothetical protein [Archangium violaceum]KFA91651.1 hypothetical protein Q664_20505 [Archangium violaceum Cb vi76]
MHRFKSSCWVALVALALPFAQSQAQQCVEADGLNVCAIGEAQLNQIDDSRIELHNLGDEGKDGAAISLGQATKWTASFVAPSTADSQRTTFTAVSDGDKISTATARKVGDTREISATFTGSGADTTYTVRAYLQGELQGEVMGVPSGHTGVVTQARQNGAQPTCRGFRQSVLACIDECKRFGFSSCAYCDVECEHAVEFKSDRVMNIGACEWTLDNQPSTPVVLTDGTTVEADRIVLLEEVRGAGSYPYVGFEQILLQTSGGTAYLGNQTVVRGE